MTGDDKTQNTTDIQTGAGSVAAPVISPKLQAVVLVVFAFLGFAGAVALYYKGAPAIIISIILGAGVASLVYGFLGGVTTTNLVLGSLKVGGSFAVLLGVAYFVNPYLQQEIHPPIYGTYEWQWAGSGWLGTIVVAKDGTAEINMEEFLNCNGQTIKKPLLAMTGKGTANADLSGNTLDVNFPVAFLKYDANCNGTEEPYTSILSGTLDRTSAFAGRIAYINPNSNKNAPSRGDMILTRYISNN